MTWRLAGLVRNPAEPWLGSGDVVLGALLGAAAGAERAVGSLVVAALAGGALAIWEAARARSLRAWVAYGAALGLVTLGVLVAGSPGGG